MIQAQELATVSAKVVPHSNPPALRSHRLARGSLFLLTVAFGISTSLVGCKQVLEKYIVEPAITNTQIEFDFQLNHELMRYFELSNGRSLEVEIKFIDDNSPNSSSTYRLPREAITVLAGGQVKFEATLMK